MYIYICIFIWSITSKENGRNDLSKDGSYCTKSGTHPAPGPETKLNLNVSS